MKSEKLISFLSEKRKFLIVVILLMLGLNIALYSHISSVKKMEQARVALEGVEKKTADSLAVVRKNQEAASIVRREKKEKAEQEILVYRAWIKQLQKFEIEVKEEVPFIDSITDLATQKVYIALNEYYGDDQPQDTICIWYYNPKYDYYLYDEQIGKLSPKLKLEKAFDKEFGEDYFMASTKPHAGHFTVGIESGTKFTPYKLKAEDIADSLKTKILKSIIPNDMNFSFKTVKKIGLDNGTLRIFLSNADAGYYRELPVQYEEQYHFTDLFVVVDYNLETAKSSIQYVGRANVIYFTDYGLAGIYCLQNRKWKKYTYGVPLA